MSNLSPAQMTAHHGVYNAGPYAPTGSLAPTADSLVTLQRQMQSWATARRTPTGLVIPPIAIPVNVFAFLQVPPYGTQGLILSYQIRPDWQAVIHGVVMGFQGQGPAPLPGDVTFVADIDRPLGSTAGYTIKDYDSVQLSIGNITAPPPSPCEWRQRNGETIRVKGTANANMGFGAFNFFVAAIYGHEWPQTGEPGW